MRKQLSYALGAALTTVAVTLPAAPAAADEFTCRGSVGARTLDNVLVPSGATCRLTGTYVKGTITVKGSATLVASRVRVVGNVQGEGHRQVTVRGSQVGGSVQVVQGRGAILAATRVTGDVQSFSNRGEQRFRNNRVNGNLQCTSSVPAPSVGGNVVGGKQGGPVPPAVTG